MQDEWSDADPDGDSETASGEPVDDADGWQVEHGDEAMVPAESGSAIDPDLADALREEWGAEFEANLALAQDGARAVADEALIDLIEESGLGNDPRIILAAARIGRLLQTGGGSADADERDALEETLEELSRRPDYWTDRVQRRVRHIHLALHGNR